HCPPGRKVAIAAFLLYIALNGRRAAPGGTCSVLTMQMIYGEWSGHEIALILQKDTASSGVSNFFFGAIETPTIIVFPE
uniref:hypothetical protein n=1 Tax=Duffyella gerundensis TaxID=1619313 RepID=UPI001CA3BA77